MPGFEQSQSYVIPGVLIGFFAYRWFKFKATKARIPDLLAQGAQIVDVRSQAEYSTGANPNSINIPLERIGAEIGRLDPSKPLILCCASGARSGAAATLLKAKGFANIINAGAWSNTLTGK